MKQANQIVIRQGKLTDLEQIQIIYADHVLHGLASFEEVPPDLYEMSRRFLTLTEAGFPYLVAAGKESGRVQGYAYAAPYRTRSGYRHTVEDSVYLSPGAAGLGIGRRLLAELIEAATGMGKRQMVAVIGDSANQASIKLHLGHGFRMVGTLEAVGLKQGRWVDSVFMQRALGKGDKELPKE